MRIRAGGPGNRRLYRDYRYLRQLLGDLEQQRLAGLAFIGLPPENWLETPIQRTPLPRVMLVSPGARLPGITPIELDPEPFASRAVEILQRRGRRQIACLMAMERAPMLTRLQRLLPAIRPEFVQEVTWWHETQARGLTHLLFCRPDDRPDGLIVLDDNLAPGILTGLQDAGVTTGKDLDLIVQGNLPHPSSLPEAAIRMGYDLHAALQAVIRVVEQGHSQPFPVPTLFPDMEKEFLP